MMVKTLRRFINLPAGRKWLLIEAVVFIFSAKVLLLILPFKTVIRISSSKRSSCNEPVTGILKEIKWALHEADRLSFWKNRCLVLSISGRWMLQRRGIASKVSLGVKHDLNNEIIAHAWLKAGHVEVVEKNGDYCELYLF